jgi:twitching motility protein PilT
MQTEGLAELLERVLELGASDLHLTAGAKPTVRVNGRLGQLEDFPVLQPAETQAMIYSILTQRQRERLEDEQELDGAHALPGRARFRLNVYFQRDSLGAALRLIPPGDQAPGGPRHPAPGEQPGPPAPGFVLVTGATGSGRSTTLASLVDLANRDREDHIMTVEDPIEFLHSHTRCLVNQREVGEDTKSFGELRDLETISIALTAASTGQNDVSADGRPTRPVGGGAVAERHLLLDQGQHLHRHHLRGPGATCTGTAASRRPDPLALAVDGVDRCRPRRAGSGRLRSS